MENEKMAILKMLEDKKISAEEAARLLEAVGKSGGEGEKILDSDLQKKVDSRKKTEKKQTYTYSQTSSQPYSQTSSQTSQTTEKTSSSADDFARDIQRKFEDFARRIEPAVKRAAEVVAEKADTFSKSFQYKPPNPDKPANPGADQSYFKSGSVEKRFDTKVEGSANQINVSGLNGDVFVRGYNGSNITGKILYRAKSSARESAREIDIIKLGNKYILNYRKEDFESVSVDLFIPEKLFNNVLVENVNGKTSVSTIVSKNILVVNRNGNASVENISSDSIKIEADNSALVISNISAKESVVENYNGSIKFLNPNVKNFKVDAFNAGVELSIENFVSFDEYLWELESANGKIYLNLPATRDIGYYVNARANLGRVEISLMGLEFITNKDNAVEARTVYYDELPVKVLLRLETSNAPITIN
jgi:DUF4097 and DUF4098 domain-containing protein YvlB